jgi:hypothetical protein
MHEARRHHRYHGYGLRPVDNTLEPDEPEQGSLAWFWCVLECQSIAELDRLWTEFPQHRSGLLAAAQEDDLSLVLHHLVAAVGESHILPSEHKAHLLRTFSEALAGRG